MSQKMVISKDTEQYKVAVVIPIYKLFSELTDNELLSLKQARRVFQKRDIFMIYPGIVNISEYEQFFNSARVKPLLLDDKYFGDYKKANKLGVSTDFYVHFTEYEYMLLYHIDAFVFSDQLDFWCSRGFDYIGAPWFLGNENPEYPLRFTGVGNGGFSLRKISSFLSIVQHRSFVNLHLGLSQVYDFLEGENHKLVRKLFFINSFQRIIEPFSGYEDEFWGLTVPRFHKWFRVASPEQAIGFAFEVKPRELFEMNNNKLPFGCHAWEKYDPEFWEKYIQPQFGMNLESDGSMVNSTAI